MRLAKKTERRSQQLQGTSKDSTGPWAGLLPYSGFDNHYGIRRPQATPPVCPHEAHSAFSEHNLEALKSREKCFGGTPVSQHINADSTAVWCRASLACDLGALVPSPKCYKMASWPEPVQICSSGLHLIIYHKSVINTKLALPFLILSSRQKFANRFLKMAWSYSTNGSPHFVGLFIVNKRAAFYEFKWIDKISQGLKEVTFYLPNIS